MTDERFRLHMPKTTCKKPIMPLRKRRQELLRTTAPLVAWPLVQKRATHRLDRLGAVPDQRVTQADIPAVSHTVQT